eukprot:5374049-Prymnesium_polylepis.1
MAAQNGHAPCLQLLIDAKAKERRRGAGQRHLARVGGGGKGPPQLRRPPRPLRRRPLTARLR